MNDRIMVAFKNDKRLKREQIISERKFPVTNVFYDKNHTYTVLDIKNETEFTRYIKALSQYIIEKYENKLLKQIINKKYPEIPNMTIYEILKQNTKNNSFEKNRAVEDILKGYFLENERGSVEGIVNFRLCEYKKILNELAENLVDIYYLNKEYEDFIELLKYFISIQTERPELVFICVKEDGTYKILDSNKNDITEETTSEIISPDETDVDCDDLLISVLISIAPKKIIVENKENIKNKQLFETIEKVFLKVHYM